jgi:hypothetical protein
LERRRETSGASSTVIKPDKLKKLLKTLLKREFPRSKKIRLYVMGKFVDEEALNTIRKIL